jgi:hypothetical protein
MRKYFVGILFIFLLPALACSLGGSDEGGEGAAQANLAAEESPATPVPVEEAVVEEVEAVEEKQAEPEMQEETSEEFAAVAGLGELSSYRVNFIMAFDGQSGGQPSKGRIEMTLEETQNPPARHLLMTMEGDTVAEVGGANEMDIYMLEDKVYLKNAAMGDSWISFSGSEAESFEQGFFAPDEQLELPDTANCSGTETVNGVEAKHCTFTEKDVAEDDVSIENLQGEVWVAVDGGYIVKYTMAATGYDSGSEEEGLFGFGDVSFEYNLTDANGDFAITLPPEAENAGGVDMGGLGGDADPGDIPVLDDAEELMAMSGFVSYYTPATVSDVVDYYRQELSALGWAENTDQTFADESTAMLGFEKDGQSMIVTVSLEDGRTSVIVTSVEQ